MPLFPFPNRLADGEYEIDGKHYQFPINDRSNNNSLHGFLSRLSPKVEILGEDSNRVALRTTYNYRGEFEYYPFPADVEVTYVLESEAELTIEFSVTNVSSASIPVGIGWHPYFQLNEAADDIELKMPEVTRVLIDSRMLPTGETPLYDSFSKFAPVGPTKFDDCFIAQSDESEYVVSLWSPKSQCGLEIWQDNQLKYIQMYIPPDRQSIAVEPMSCAINAFQTGEGLITLRPDESFQRKFGVRLVTEK